MSLIAPTLQAFFTERLITERNCSPQTIASYRDAIRLLLTYAQQRTGKQPFQLDFDDLDAPLIGAFLTHLEEQRGNSPRTRNNRLAAIHSFCRYSALKHPEHAHTIARVMAIPTNDRLLDAQLQACNCAPGPSTLTRLVSLSIEDGQPAPALHFTDPRVMALFACLCCFQHLFAGLTNRTLRPQIAELIPGYSTGQMTYDLRRLRRKGLIRRITRSQRYELTAFGRRTAVFFTKTYVRIVNPSLAELDPHLPEEIAHQHPLARAWRAFEHALDDKTKQAAIAA